MAIPGNVEQWGTYWADLEPTVGSEQGGDRRPVLVVSNNGFNSRFSVVTVLPLTKATGKTRKVYPFEVLLPAAKAGNPEDNIVMPPQIRTIAKSRLLERVGLLDDPELRREVEDRILDHLGITLEDVND
ncbi:MAG TPA: type II toxin-antitoxin system PemK/MazF family toxin [Gemmatimonadaceae bacterium]